MLTARKVSVVVIAVVAALVISAMSSVALADTQATYRWQRIPMGPRADQFILVRVNPAPPSELPYALTGDDANRNAYRAATRSTPSHPKGTHGEY